MAKTKKLMICGGRHLCNAEDCDHAVVHERKGNCGNPCQRSGLRCMGSPVLDYIVEVFQ